MSSYLLLCLKTKETNKYNILLLPWLSLLHFHQLVSFLENRNAAIIMFSFFKGSSEPAESRVYLPRSYNFTKQKVSESLEILSSHSLRLLVGFRLFSTFDCLFRQGNISTRPKSFFYTLSCHFPR